MYTLKRLIYHLFIDDHIPPVGEGDYVFVCKDGDEGNVLADNIQLYTRSEYMSLVRKRWGTNDDNNRYTINNAQTDYDIYTDDIGKYVAVSYTHLDVYKRQEL